MAYPAAPLGFRSDRVRFHVGSPLDRGDEAPGACGRHPFVRRIRPGEGGWVPDHRRMIVKLDTQRLQTLDQVREFLAGSRPLDLQPQTRAEAYNPYRLRACAGSRRLPRGGPVPRGRARVAGPRARGRRGLEPADGGFTTAYAPGPPRPRGRGRERAGVLAVRFVPGRLSPRQREAIEAAIPQRLGVLRRAGAPLVAVHVCGPRAAAGRGWGSDNGAAGCTRSAPPPGRTGGTPALTGISAQPWSRPGSNDTLLTEQPSTHDESPRGDQPHAALPPIRPCLDRRRHRDSHRGAGRGNPAAQAQSP